MVKGFHFIDNKLDKRFGAENGYVTTTTIIPVPKQLSVCLWTFAEFDRYGEQIPIIEFMKLNETIPPFISMMYRSDGANSPRIGLDGIATFYMQGYPVLERKWLHLCASIDIEKDEVILYLNGKSDFKSQTPTKSIKSKISKNTEVPMVIRLGHYYFDTKPLIGKLAEVNVWDRILSVEELANYSNCIPYKISGNIVNEETIWTITGTLIQEELIPKSVIECSLENKIKTVFVTIPYQNFQ
ncbi:uncharacterized protein LOC111714532, partial [Eurytemora carolleeae]|uniref:uncharacterized protein LOC111714532 n=1 Tax=Eurytemora carolleeae TaxID=1294199 RepID=UPI000C78E7B3